MIGPQLGEAGAEDQMLHLGWHLRREGVADSGYAGGVGDQCGAELTLFVDDEIDVDLLHEDGEVSGRAASEHVDEEMSGGLQVWSAVLADGQPFASRGRIEAVSRFVERQPDDVGVKAEGAQPVLNGSAVATATS